MKMKILTTLIIVFAAASASAQGLKETGVTVEEIIPEGWEYSHATGDLNQDGIDDLVVMATPNDPAHLKVRDDGYVYNFNEPILAIYFGTRSGTFKCWKQYPHTMPYPTDEYILYDYSLNTTERHTLTIHVGTMATMGSWGQNSHSYVFRYQNQDFFLIGEDESYLIRNTGELTVDSYNYLTNKKQTVVSNEFDTKVKPRERWTRLPKQPLKRLGNWTLDV